MKPIARAARRPVQNAALTATAIAVGAALLSFPTAASAKTYDLQADWSTTTNPNGVWTLRQGTTALGSVADWQGFGVTAWAPSNMTGNFLPAFFKANFDGSTNPGGVCATCNFLTGDLVVHTTDGANGVGEGPASVLFVAPVAGVADISGLTWAARSINRTQDWALLIDGVTVDSGVLPGDGTNDRAAPDTFMEHVALSAGEQVELLMTQDPAAPFGDFVGYDLKVALTPTGVPEPATWAMMLVGFGGLGAAMRSRRKSVAETA